MNTAVIPIGDLPTRDEKGRREGRPSHFSHRAQGGNWPREGTVGSIWNPDSMARPVRCQRKSRNLPLLLLQPYCPQPSRIETLFSVQKHRHFAIRVIGSADHVRRAVEEVWNGLTSDTGEIVRITARSWSALYQVG